MRCKGLRTYGAGREARCFAQVARSPAFIGAGCEAQSQEKRLLLPGA